MADVAVQPAAEPLRQSRPPGPLPDRLAFRFCCCRLLYALHESGRVNVLRAFPGGGIMAKPYIDLWHTICPWVAIDIFHLSGRPATCFVTGSGRTTPACTENLHYTVSALAAGARTTAPTPAAPCGPLHAGLHAVRLWFRQGVPVAVSSRRLPPPV